RRQQAFDAERADWEAKGEFARVEALTAETSDAGPSVAVTAPEGCELVEAPLGGSVWKVRVEPGDRVEAGDVIAVIEAMKTECDVPSPTAGVVRAVYAREKDAVAAGAPIIALETT
ncbi:MAG: biotin/lipoyl-binding protein, partial [Phenylobacterium sp.]|nr:biotin/lipoyl-binding protein [Phenylobacterium sp.]